MTAAERIGTALRRLASTTSILHTRADDAARFERHAGMNGDIERREALFANRVERVASDYDKKLTEA